MDISYKSSRERLNVVRSPSQDRFMFRSGMDGYVVCVTTNSRRVVLVDDNEDVRRASELMLMACGYDVVASVSDGVAALGAIAGMRPDLVVTDLEMPGLNGLELLQALRDRSETRTLPVAVYTASAELRADDVHGFGYAALMRKPASMRLLRESIDALLSETPLIGVPAARTSPEVAIA